VPLTSGAHDVTVYGAVALKLNASCRVILTPDCMIVVKSPTAYMIPPHSVSCRICSAGPASGNAGVPVAGCGDTGPGGTAASARAAGPNAGATRTIEASASTAAITPTRDRAQL
jgi:hypothetical protein